MSRSIVTSYGIICYCLKYNATTNSVHPEYLMIQRKDSVCFVEFIRGKYSLTQKEYIKTLFSNMTPAERELIRTSTFDEVWKALCNNMYKTFTEHNASREKYKALKLGMNAENENGKYLFDINYIIDNTTSRVPEPQWEFPKGRRNMSENNVDCAVREFEEETNISRTKIILSNKICPISLEKMGCNGVLYRGMYFVAKCIDKVDNASLSILNDVQKREISSVKWFDFAGIISRLHNEEQVKSFEKLNKRILESVIVTY